MEGVQPCAGFGLHQQSWPCTLRCPLPAGIVKRIIDPRQRALVASKVIYRLQFPMRASLPWVAFELQVGELSRQAEPLRQVVIGLLFPAGAPNEFEMIAQARQVLGRAGRTEMKYSIDVQPFSLWQSVGTEAKQRYDTVNIDEQQRFA